MGTLVPFTLVLMAARDAVEEILPGVPAYITEELSSSGIVIQFEVVPDAWVDRARRCLVP